MQHYAAHEGSGGDLRTGLPLRGRTMASVSAIRSTQRLSVFIGG
jgi:hypothetical protein